MTKYKRLHSTLEYDSDTNNADNGVCVSSVSEKYQNYDEDEDSQNNYDEKSQAVIISQNIDNHQIGKL